MKYVLILKQWTQSTVSVVYSDELSTELVSYFMCKVFNGWQFHILFNHKHCLKYEGNKGWKQAKQDSIYTSILTGTCFNNNNNALL